MQSVAFSTPGVGVWETVSVLTQGTTGPWSHPWYGGDIAHGDCYVYGNGYVDDLIGPSAGFTAVFDSPRHFSAVLAFIGAD